MDGKTKQDFIKLFNQGFEEVVLPEIEELRKDVGILKQGLGRVENTLDKVADKVNDHANKISKLEKRNQTISPLS